MAVNQEHEAVKDFDQWYVERTLSERTGGMDFKGLSPAAESVMARYRDYKREMDARTADFIKLELLADGEVISPKPDLPNVSSGETAGIVRRMARNLVQHAPNVEVISKFDSGSVGGAFSKYILNSKIVGVDQYSNDTQQNLFASTKTALTIGFDCVVPCLEQNGAGEWFIRYDTIHYRDVFPEPGVKDIRDANEVFVRRYLTKGDILALIRNNTPGWDVEALKTLLHNVPRPPNRDVKSNSLADTKRRAVAEGYEIVTWYTSSGEPFLSFSPTQSLLFRIEKNVHPAKEQPVHFLILEKDDQQPLGKSQVELLLGRQEFQDLMHNGAMKLWYRNINPSIIGYGAINAVPNLSPGKYTPISNPNAKIEAFEVNTQTLMQYQSISQGNLGSMVQMVGAADQQMATQNAGGGMSQTPQGVDAQEAMVDITTNNYQKAIESFFSHYCSYALTLYFQELKSTQKIEPSADARIKLIDAGMPETSFDEDGMLEADFSDMATQYYVRCVPGSLVELEDEKQLRILNQLFVPLSQAMPALANAGDERLVANAAAAMQYIVEKQIELSGSNRAGDLETILKTGRTEEFNEYEARAQALEDRIGQSITSSMEDTSQYVSTIKTLEEKMMLMEQTQQALLEKLGVGINSSTPQAPSGQPTNQPAGEETGRLSSARAS